MNAFLVELVWNDAPTVSASEYCGMRHVSFRGTKSIPASWQSVPAKCKRFRPWERLSGCLHTIPRDGVTIASEMMKIIRQVPATTQIAQIAECGHLCSRIANS